MTRIDKDGIIETRIKIPTMNHMRTVIGGRSAFDPIFEFDRCSFGMGRRAEWEMYLDYEPKENWPAAVDWRPENWTSKNI